MSDFLDEDVSTRYIVGEDLHNHQNLIDRALELQLGSHRIFTADIKKFSEHPKLLIILDAAREDTNNQIDPKVDYLIKDAVSEFTTEYAIGSMSHIQGVNQEGEVVSHFYDDHLIEFINKYEIQTIVLLGQVAFQNLSLLPESYYKGQSPTKLVNTFPYFADNLVISINYHPQFILKNGGTESDSFQAFKNKFKRTLQKSKIDIDVTKDYDIKLVNLDQLDEVLTLFTGEKDIATDYEANDLDPWNVSTRPTGFSIATDKVARYVIIDRPLTPEESDKIVAFFTKHSPWTYNCKYEMKMTWAKMGKLVMMNDSMVLCTVDGHRGSLKNNARFYLDAEFWEEDVHFIVDTFDSIFGQMRSIKKTRPDLITKVMKDGDYKALISELEDPECKAHRYRTISGLFTQLLNVITPEEISAGVKWYPTAWGAVPPRILGEYCCMDSIYTIKLKKLLWDKHKTHYAPYIVQSWLACVMESYGMIWDNEYAGDLETFYCEDAIASLYNLIMMFNVPNEFKEFATKVFKSEISEDTVIKYDLDPESKPWDVKIRSIYDKLDALKVIFNPLSNKYESQLKFWNSYNTDSSLPIILLHHIEVDMAQGSSIPEELQASLIDKSSLDNTLNNLINLLNEVPKYSESLYKILSDLEEAQVVSFKGFASDNIEFHYTAHTKYSPALSCKVCKTIYEDQELENTVCPSCNSDKVKITRGVDPDNKNTWTPEFWMLYYLRRFKKVNKSRSTYVQGQVGRGNVYLARYRGFHEPPVRLGNYYDVMESFPDYKLKPNERWVMNTDFNSNAAETLRWTARIHCLVGDTKIHLADGRDLPIEDLYQEYLKGIQNYVYTVNDGRYEIEDITQVQLSGYVTELAEITLDNGEIIKSTTNHRFMKFDGEYVEAKDLTPELSMYPFYTELEQYSGSSGHRIIYQPYDNEWEMAHYLSDRYNEKYDLLRDMSNDEFGRNNSWCRHHIDFNPLNNNPTNVNRFGWVTHSNIHFTSSEGHYASWRTIKEKIKNDPEFAKDWYSKKEANGRTCFNTFWHGENSEEFRKRHAVRNQLRVQSLCRTESSKESWRIQQQLGKVRSLLNLIEEYNLSASTAEEYMLSREILNSKNVINFSAYPTSWYVEEKTGHTDWTTMKSKIDDLVPNHKIKSVKIVTLDSPVPVYDLSVKDKTPCFALSAGIVSHNTVPWNCILGSEKIPVIDEDIGQIEHVSVESLSMLPDAEKFFTFSAYTDNKELTPSIGYYARHVKDVPTLTFKFGDDKPSLTVSEDQLILKSDGDWIYAKDVTYDTDIHIANLDFLTN